MSFFVFIDKLIHIETSKLTLQSYSHISLLPLRPSFPSLYCFS